MKKRIAFISMVLVAQLALIAPCVSATGSSDMVALLTAKLESWDVEEIWPLVQEALAEQPQDPELLEIASHIAFHRGNYPESLQLMKRSMAVGGENEKRRGFALFIEETINVLAPYKRYETPHFIIHLNEAQDGILVDYLSDALEKTYTVMSRYYGFKSKHKVRVELFPDAKAFYLASTLSVRDIEVTGAVGLTKFNKLQFLSPRALVYGYRWLDAISHEYMHYLIVKLTSNKAPIWFHEGLSKYEETRWRNGPTYLSPLYQTLLAQAQADNKLIAFVKMEPSLIHLDTPEEVQLAYAQGASAIEFIISRIGYEGLKKVMERMAQGETKGAGEAVKEMMGLEFSEFEAQWKAFLRAKEIKPVAGTKIQPYKVKEGKASEERMDMAEIKSLVARNRAHLGDKLKERGRTGAAVIEYRRALAEMQHAVPVMNRLSAALIDLGRDEEALDMLKRTRDLAPDHPTPHTQLGQVYFKLKDFKKAKEAFEEAIQINPFNPDVHVGLADACSMLGDNLGSAQERAIAHRLRR
ncbi:MAG: tetratricopeptide repeat protein [Desulfobacterales bacterium]|jgi:tetratricopeptide (TPR) repeat protein